jgi:hypothetical protein
VSTTTELWRLLGTDDIAGGGDVDHWYTDAFAAYSAYAGCRFPVLQLFRYTLHGPLTDTLLCDALNGRMLPGTRKVLRSRGVHPPK